MLVIVTGNYSGGMP